MRISRGRNDAPHRVWRELGKRGYERRATEQVRFVIALKVAQGDMASRADCLPGEGELE